MSPPRDATRSSGSPSSSAATMRADVSVPVPMSWMPVVTSARPSASRRIDACAGGPPPPHQICVAQPIPRRSPSAPGSRSASRLGPAGELGGAVVAREQPLARVRQPGPLVGVDVVQPAQLERVEVEPRGELVHRLVEHGHALDDARRAERVLRAQARPDGEDHRPDVLAGVEGQGGLGDGEDPAARAHLDDRGELDRLQRPVAARAEGDGLARPRAPSADDLVLVAGQREAHRPAGGPRELGCEERLDARALLRAEAAADELRDHADALARKAEPRSELAPRVEHALRRDPRREPVAVPARDRGVGLERRLDVRGRLAGQLDEHLGSRDRRRRDRRESSRAAPP